MAPKLGEMLLKAKLISDEQLTKALEHQKESGGKLGKNLVDLGYLQDQQITQFLSQQFGVPAVDLSQFKEIDQQVIKLVPADVARKYQVMPLTRTGATLTIAMVDPTNVFAMDDIKFMTGYNVEPVVASETAIGEAIESHYGVSAEIERKQSEMEDIVSAALQSDADLEMVEEDEELSESELSSAAEEAPVVKLVNLVLTDALKRGASDIHIEPYEKEFRVRFRIDGVCYEIMKPPLKLKDCRHQPRQDHGQAGHLREAVAAGRPHQDQDEARGQGQGPRLPRLDHPLRSTARRSSSVCSTRTI